MTKDGITLASDLAVTTPENKSYTCVDKILKLNDELDIAVMINGRVDFEEINMESLINDFGKNIEFSTVEKVKDEFIDYLSKKTNPTSIDEYLKPIIEDFKNELLFEIEDVGFDEAIDMYKQDKLNDYFKQYSNFKNEFTDIIPDDKDKIKYNLKIWEIFSHQFLFEGTGVIFAGFDEDNFHPSFSEINIYHNNNGEIIYDEVDSIVNCKEAYIKVFAIKEEAYTFLTGVSEDFKEYLIEYTESSKNKFINALRKDLINNDYPISIIEKIESSCNTLLDAAYSNLSDLIENYKFNAIQDISSSSQFLPNRIHWDLADHLIKLTALKQKFSSQIESVSRETEIVHISKKDGFTWVKKEEVTFK